MLDSRKRPDQSQKLGSSKLSSISACRWSQRGGRRIPQRIITNNAILKLLVHPPLLQEKAPLDGDGCRIKEADVVVARSSKAGKSPCQLSRSHRFQEARGLGIAFRMLLSLEGKEENGCSSMFE